jgi:hypothetical protein
MAVNAIQSNTQVPKAELQPKVQQQQPQQVPEKPKEAPAVKPQEQTKGTGLVNTFA